MGSRRRRNCEDEEIRGNNLFLLFSTDGWSLFWRNFKRLNCFFPSFVVNRCEWLAPKSQPFFAAGSRHSFVFSLSLLLPDRQTHTIWSHHRWQEKIPVPYLSGFLKNSRGRRKKKRKIFVNLLRLHAIATFDFLIAVPREKRKYFYFLHGALDKVAQIYRGDLDIVSHKIKKSRKTSINFLQSSCKQRESRFYWFFLWEKNVIEKKLRK